jgi:serine/threonine protein kinase
MPTYARGGNAPAAATHIWTSMAEITAILCPSCHKANPRRAKFCQHCGHDVVLNNESPSDERRYAITRIVKQGGQGAIYEGIDESGQIFAIKEMLDRFTDPKERAEAIDRFNSEAELLQQLTHPRIPRVYSHFRDTGRHYLTMDFIRGEDLEQIVERDGPQSEATVLEWADQICDVLSFLHGEGLVYRDMKPSNVMIERDDGGVKLVDFGITKLFKPTERGTQIGTPGYAPPEQYQGLATPLSDVYALGATLHHLLTGRDPTEQMPFDFPPARSLNPAISQGTSAALERALQKVARDRFQSIDDFWKALIPARKAAPAQVRVIQPTAPLPAAAAAKVGTTPAMAGAPSPIPGPAAQPQQPAAAPGSRAQSQTQPQAQPQPQRPQRSAPPRPVPRRGRQRGFFATLGVIISRLFTLALIAAIGLGGYVFVTRPAWAEPYLSGILPGTAPTSAPLRVEQVSYPLEVQVAANADEATLLTAFRAAFLARARLDYGPNTLTASNLPPTYIGTPERVGSDGTTATYRVQMQGYVTVP